MSFTGDLGPEAGTASLSSVLVAEVDDAEGATVAEVAEEESIARGTATLPLIAVATAPTAHGQADEGGGQGERDGLTVEGKAKPMKKASSTSSEMSHMMEKKRRALAELRKSLSFSVTPEEKKRKKNSTESMLSVAGGGCGGGGDGEADHFDAALTESLDAIPDDEYTKLLQFCVWPCNKFDHFKAMLARKPQEIHTRFGMQQETLLHRACRYGNHRVFSFLLTKDAALTARNKSGGTPLHLACQFDRLEMIKSLVQAGVPLDEKDELGDQAIHYSAKAGSIEAILYLLDKGVYKCVPGYRKNTILHYAASSGSLDLIGRLMDEGCDPNQVNGLTERPLHLLCKTYQTANNFGIDVAKRLLSAGADLNARTVWGDTAAHYAGLWSGPQLFQFLLERGAEVHKSKEVCMHPSFYVRMSVSPEEQENFEMTLLQKVAKSTCIVKANIVIERIMKARNKLATNMYYGNRGIDIGRHSEMNNQELSFLAMSREMIMGDNTYFDKVNKAAPKDDKNPGSKKNSMSAIEMFLKYSPDSLKRLFDLCICKPCFEQVQGKVYFDFFLFDPHNSDSSASELRLINLLINSGKERLLIHPIFETFLKLKWYRCFYFYVFYVILDFIFLLSLGGFTMAHFGQLYEGQANWEFGTRNAWWWFLAAAHVYSAGFTATRTFQNLGYMRNYCVKNRKTETKKTNLLDKTVETAVFTVKNLITPILLGLTLYGNISEQHARYYLSFSLILSCYHFMTVISRMPRIGLYVNMLSKVMTTVLNFFASYVWHFLGYAIAFHVLLGSGPFALFTDSFVKVMTMLMGEYDYTINFVNNPNSSYIAKAVFAVFVVDMSVVLMNLVLGLAVSDIEELRRNSAVRRMMQETCGVDFMENLFQVLCVIPGCANLFSHRITNMKSSNFEDVVYLDLVDLDKSPSNCIVIEKQSFPHGVTANSYSCPHHIVQSVGNIIKEEIRVRRANGSKEESLLDVKQIKDNQASIMEKLDALEAALKALGKEEDDDLTKIPSQAILMRTSAVD